MKKKGKKLEPVGGNIELVFSSLTSSIPVSPRVPSRWGQSAETPRSGLASTPGNTCQSLAY